MALNEVIKEVTKDGFTLPVEVIVTDECSVEPAVQTRMSVHKGTLQIIPYYLTGFFQKKWPSPPVVIRWWGSLKRSGGVRSKCCGKKYSWLTDFWRSLIVAYTIWEQHWYLRHSSGQHVKCHRDILLRLLVPRRRCLVIFCSGWQLCGRIFLASNCYYMTAIWKMSHVLTYGRKR